MPIICDSDPRTARRLTAGFREHGVWVPDLGAVRAALAAHPDELVIIIGPHMEISTTLEFTMALREREPALGVVLVRETVDVAMLSECMRAGVREVVPDRDFPALLDACKRSWELSSSLRSAAHPPTGSMTGGRGPERPQGKVVVVFSAKGGCGKSMLSTNLAATLAREQGRRVCLVDLDLPFGDVAIMLGLEPHRTLVDAVPMAEHMDETGVRSMLVQHRSGLATALAPIAPGDAERISASLVTELLAVLRRLFDIVVIDTPSQLSEQVLAGMDAADLHLLLAGPEVTALKGLRVTLDMLDMLGYRREQQAIILNRADTRAGLSPADIARVAGRPIAVEIPTSADVPASINRGMPLALTDPGHPVSEAVRRVAGLLPLDETAGDNGQARRRGGLRRKAQRS